MKAMMLETVFFSFPICLVRFTNLLGFTPRGLLTYILDKNAHVNLGKFFCRDLWVLRVMHSHRCSFVGHAFASF